MTDRIGFYSPFLVIHQIPLSTHFLFFFVFFSNYFKHSTFSFFLELERTYQKGSHSFPREEEKKEIDCTFFASPIFNFNFFPFSLLLSGSFPICIG